LFGVGGAGRHLGYGEKAGACSSRVDSKSNAILEKDFYFEIYRIKQLIAVVGLDAGRLRLTWMAASGGQITRLRSMNTNKCAP
jgi:hypothetical protein